MITQDFLTEFESCLLRSYGRACKKSDPTKTPTNFVTTVSSQHEFITAFMDTFTERRSILEGEIQKGGHRNPALLVEKIQRTVEAKIRTALIQKGNVIDTMVFQKMVRDLKWEIRTIFYE
ncbi:MAG: hypothetical protein QT02_C0001G0096 [archaeon GW2011_AR9]|nr:MAG: hypothetical protein QT02_C0001G0096 [archaeon GW2011_AR9]HIG92931.1 hypothetical protein [Candidatus Woesearchaeota archaeon]HIH12717.1 hypothetical protein [Candidatus Woesearchaeota archaeon]